MAPLKRARIAVDSDDMSGDLDSTEGGSSLANDSQTTKRLRMSLEATHDSTPRTTTREDGSSSEEEEDDDDVDNGADIPNSPPQTQYEIMRDAGFKHLQNTDKDDFQATQKLRRRPTNVVQNMAAESGIIESITCYNFMCHERLHVELGPLINFIVGENGSGKSAVLTALTLCLGGKASDTNRGGSLKSFVKEGQDHGSLVVKIKNAGSDAYQPDIYGDSILVERHFSKSGSSGFKIKNEQGRIISTKKQEVDEISEWYALQMGNPLTVLSQDNARQFLNSATPAQKYKYFVSGVQLEQLDNDYKMSQDTLDRTIILRDDLSEKIAHVKKEMEDAQRLAETVQRNNTLRERARHYRNQLVWSQVVEREQELELQNAELETRKQKIIQLEKNCDELSRALDEITEKLERAEATRNGLNEEYRAIGESIASAEGIYTGAKKDLTELHLEERDAFARLKAVKADIETYETRIREEEAKLVASSGFARVEKEAEHKRAQAREAELNDQIEDCTQQLPSLQSKIAEIEHAVKRHQQLKEQKRKDIVAAEQGVRELEKSTGSIYDGFDRDIIQLVKAVAADSGFGSKPLGPLGAHIKLLKPEWSGILEKTLGDALNAFVVRSKRDQSRLSSLIRQSGMKRPPPVYIAYGGRIDTASQEPADEYDTILRVLEFDDELVRSQLIINHQIEKVILIKDRVQAEAVMIDSGPPRNVAACICFHDGKGKRGQGLRITNRAGTIGTAPTIPSGMRPRMQSDAARQLAMQKDNLKQLGLELRDLMAEEGQALQALQKAKQELEKHKKNMKALENDLRRTQADIEKAAEELDTFEGVDDRLDLLRSELSAKRTEETQLGNQYGSLKLSKRELGAKAEEAKKKLDAARDEQKDFQNRVSKSDTKIQSYNSMRRITVSKKNHEFEQVDMGRAALNRAESKRDEKAEQVQDFIRQAEEVAPGRVHIPDGEDHQSIEKKYEKIGEQLAQREARIGATDQEIYDRANEASIKYESVLRQTQDVDETIMLMKRAIEHRLHLWRQFQRQISARIRIQFNYLLSERGFRGKIDLDHRGRKVTIHIEPDETKKSSAGRNTKTLSGGEKSFSSICMLLSVWEAIGSPIRCLDEFDVFMDNVNRAISTNMLVDAARRSVSRQYILITPNAIEGRARLDKDVKIIRLTDPRQRTLV
ncbi:Structural maintenance of chromosomes protein 6 [Metarhizium brunneum]|uniref:Structural maintenance of chromosomes protein 6 n=1 Tax=Metarhizium brunneum TaxID=500148 RepID=A0A7D5UV95_9HYPO|nr:Structural maintenance of chromosomes protein 6 [Metarhizium brunneum]